MSKFLNKIIYNKVVKFVSLLLFLLLVSLLALLKEAFFFFLRQLKMIINNCTSILLNTFIFSTKKLGLILAKEKKDHRGITFDFD